MAEDEKHRVTRLLGELRAGRKEVEHELAELVYQDLLRIAEQRMRRERSQTLEPGALVHECWIRLADQTKPPENRSQFLAVASRIMMRVLLDAGRRRAADRRGGAHQRITLSFELAAAEADEGVEAKLLGEALERFEGIAPRKAEVARLRGLVGLSIAETAAELGVSQATTERDWSFARAWLSREVERLKGGSGGGEPPVSGFSEDS